MRIVCECIRSGACARRVVFDTICSVQWMSNHEKIPSVVSRGNYFGALGGPGSRFVLKQRSNARAVWEARMFRPEVRSRV